MELVNVYSTGRTVDFQRYDDKDNQLIVSSYTNTEMDPNADVVEVTVYGESGEFLDYNQDVTTYKVSQGNVNPVTGFYTKIELDPKADVNALGLTRGRVSAQYNLLKPLFNSSNVSKYWIKEISTSGTELKLSSQNVSNEVIRAGFANFQAYVSTKNYYVDFYLNFAQNRLVIANNAILSEEDGEVYLLIKLYEPLPEDFEVKDTLWICDRIADSVIYTVDTQIVEDPTDVQNALRGPNNRIKIRERVGQTTPYYSYSSLFSSTMSSSLQQLLSYYQDKSIEINVDYSNFANFIHFSSATERVNNFVYKLGLIEQYKAEIEDTTTFSSMSPSSLTIVSQSNVLAQQSIDNIINKFDTYEYYLYFSSESFAWPKSNSTKPYQLHSVTSPQALAWLGDEYTRPSTSGVSILYSASFYDNTNKDKLSNAIPQYLLEDANNQPYVTFIDMVGQHFDNLWLYYKDLSNRYSSFNSPNLGLSKDMVADALRGFGFNLYTNTSVSDNLYYTLFGVNQDGSLLPPTGSELINEYVTSSIDTLSPKQLDAEVYKRMYHNLSYLLKTKGTQRAVKALIACYGIPEDILDVNEFGGNSRYTGSGIYEINDQKINYFTQTTQLSSSVLSPYVTLQEYNTDNRLNTNDVEVGFSPSDQINRNFVSSSGFVNLDQLIGNPNHQYLSYYPDLKTASDNYFASYNYPHSIWEYIRIIKYYNNSLFKTIKDFVPSKANASTGIIVKSHILERNKYARHEPSMSFDNNISESIDMVSIAGSDPGAVQGSTQYADIINTSLGYVTKDYTEDLAKFTGRLSGSFVQATTGEAFDQSDYSTTASGSVEVDFPANYQNAITANRSKRFLELDYAYNQNQPTNLPLITKAIGKWFDNFEHILLENGNFLLTEPNEENLTVDFDTDKSGDPYAYIQDYNYATRAFTDARYYGSKTTSLVYNTYTAPISGGYVGDSSYGKTAAIDRYSIKVGWVKNFQSQSLNFNDKTSITLKYLVDENQNLVELNQRNENLFEVQNIFKSGNNVIISLSDLVKPSFQKTLDGSKRVFKGGFSYDPILFREIGETLTFLLPGQSKSSNVFLGYKGIETNFSYFYMGDIIRSQIFENKLRFPFLTEYSLAEWNNASRRDRFNARVGGPPDTEFKDSQYIYQDTAVASSAYGALEWASKIDGQSDASLGNVNNDSIKANWGTGLSRVRSIFEEYPDRVSPINGRQTYKSLKDSLFYYQALGKDDPTIYDIKTEDFFKINFDNTGSNGGYYTEKEIVRPNDILFKAARPGVYKVSMLFPINVAASYYEKEDVVYTFNPFRIIYPNTPFQDSGVSFKVFFALEKKEKDTENWQIVGHTYIKTIGGTQGAIELDQINNVIHFKKNQGLGYYPPSEAGANNYLGINLQLQFWSPVQTDRDLGVTPIYLNLLDGDELRLRFYLIDLDQHANAFGRDFGISWGNFPATSFTQPRPFFEIVDINSPDTAVEQTITYSEPNTLTAQNNQLIFSEEISNYFISTSIFVPSTDAAVGAVPTSTYYTNVIDTVSIQTGDIMRLGSFKNPEPQYFNIVTASLGYPVGIENGNTLIPPILNNTYIGAIFRQVNGRSASILRNIIQLSVAQGVNQSALDFFNKILTNPGSSKKFTITDAPTSLISAGLPTTFTIKSVRQVTERYIATSISANIPIVEIEVVESIPINTFSNRNFSPTIYSDGYWTGGVSCNFVSPTTLYPPRVIATLDRSIPASVTNISKNFAILRPKPDETSVIVDFKKLDGNVSQAILVPNDANKNIKDKLADLFRGLNVDLSQQQIQ